MKRLELYIYLIINVKNAKLMHLFPAQQLGLKVNTNPTFSLLPSLKPKDLDWY